MKRNTALTSALAKSNPRIRKAPTGIPGLDEVTGGGLPAGRPTLISGSAGAGKTMLAVEFLIHGAIEYNEPGVFMMFEENEADLTANVRSLGFDLDRLRARKKIALDYVYIERTEIEETGTYDLEALFIRLAHLVDTIGAKRVVLDTIEALFSGIPNHAILRAELRRLFRWLKSRGLTAVITGERGGDALTRYGLEEYVADCVILLDHRVTEQISTRRLRVVKYRGSPHGTNEYPFLIGPSGISVLPITSLRLDHAAPTKRLGTGIPSLDSMLGGHGVFRGSSVLISGSPGTGKSSIGAALIDAAGRRGERCLLFAYEESAHQVLRNMSSIGLDLGQWVKKGLLQIHASRPTLQGLEQHLLTMHDVVSQFRPALVVVDPISNLTFNSDDAEIKPTLMRLIDFLKKHEITGVFTSLTNAQSGVSPEDSQVGVSSLMDTWLLLRNVESNGERNRTLYVLKSRGMPHSNQVREFVLTHRGISLIDVYTGPDRVLTGTARLAQEAQERAAAEARRADHQNKLRHLASKQQAIAARIAALKAEGEAEAAEVRSAIDRETSAASAQLGVSTALARLRNAGGNGKKGAALG